MLNLPGNALFAVAAAAAWGGGDFSGGMGVKAVGGTLRGALRLILLAHLASLLVLVVIVLAQQHQVPSGTDLAWGLGAGVAAALSLTAFYMALAKGVMGASAALSGLLAAAIPVVVSVILEGSPGWIKGCGFALALAAIWIIAAGNPSEQPAGKMERQAVGLAICGGIGFGIYFVSLQRANSLGVFEPMMLARAGSVLTCLVLLILLAAKPSDHEVPLGRKAIVWAGGIALLDTGGNLLFIAATRLGRLDVAAVLASLYPASTILLAAWQLHERPSRRQGFGMLLALAAVVLITL